MRVVLKAGVDHTQAKVLSDFFKQSGFYYRYLDNTPTIELIVNLGFEGNHLFNHQVFSHLIDQIIIDKSKRYFTNIDYQPKDKILKIHDVYFGGDNVVMIGGPCSIESEEQIHQTAQALSLLGVQVLRGGAFKPRTSAYDFQGLGVNGLVLMADAAKKYGMLSVSEIMDSHDLDDFLTHVDIIQVGARNMQNFALLKVLGRQTKPVLLKRGLSATYKEFLAAAEYIAAGGNEKIILCERGIRTFESATRNTLDISAVPILKALSHLPVIIDPSHAIGHRSFVPALAYAALAAGVDGLMIEAHPEPDLSISDASQTISFTSFENIMQTGNQICRVFGKTLGRVKDAS